MLCAKSDGNLLTTFKVYTQKTFGLLLCGYKKIQCTHTQTVHQQSINLLSVHHFVITLYTYNKQPQKPSWTEITGSVQDKRNTIAYRFAPHYCHSKNACLDINESCEMWVFFLKHKSIFGWKPVPMSATKNIGTEGRFEPRFAHCLIY